MGDAASPGALVSPPDSPAALAARVQRELAADAPRFALEVVAECASTNDELAAMPLCDDDRIAVLVAQRQHAGRGRRGRVWHGDGGLTFSCAWRIPDDAPPPTALSLAVGLAVAEAVTRLGVASVALKWPNDVLVGEHKLAGILIELVSGQRRACRAIIGIGLNVATVPVLPHDDARTPTALAQHLSEAPDPAHVLAVVLRCLAARLEAFAAGGFGAMREDWQRYDTFAGRTVCVEGDGSRRVGRCDGVDADGALRLATGDGFERVLSGELSLRPAA
jgi:BirA family biotin operon repressor/biotin-[acetyl-CoA-carboxylase] ligase